jgi:MinD-like ATPase involved in chromosome partitioning or flagellar assembly
VSGSDGTDAGRGSEVPEAAEARTGAERPDGGELTTDTIVRPRVDRPEGGWRGLLHTATGGLLNPGPGPAELARREQVRRIRRPLGSAHQIAVSSINGGVGKTTVAACLGLVLAANRGDRIVALDACPNAGTLADRLTGDASVTVRDMIGHVESMHSLADVARFTSLAGRLQVLASEQDPAMSEAFDRAEYERVCTVLRRFYNVVITDSGSGLVHSAIAGTLALADSLVIVGSPTADGASRANKTLDWLIVRGHADLVADAVLVLTCDRAGKHIDTARVRRHFEGRCRAVVEVPFDPHLATGARIELDRIRPATHDAFRTLAAHVADRFDVTPVGVGANLVTRRTG